MYSVYLLHIPPFLSNKKSHFYGFHYFSADLLFVYFFSTFFLLSLNKRTQFPAYCHKNILPLYFSFLLFTFLFFVFLFCFSDYFFSFCFLFSSSTYFLHSSPILHLCSILAPSSCRVASFTCRVFISFCSLLPLHRSSPFFTYFFARGYSSTNIFFQHMFLGIQYDISSLHTEYVN